MSKPTEALNDILPGPPLIYRRRIGWADTDAARIVYTVRLFDFGMSAVEAWFSQIWGEHWYRMHVEHDMGCPFVHLDMDIHAPLVPEDILSIRILVENVGRTSLTFRLDGSRQDRVPCFTARYVNTLVCMSPMHSVEIPADKRALARRYAARSEAAATA